MWWFELVDMCHKLFQVSVLAFIEEPADQLRCAMLVAVIYLGLILTLRPYIRKGDDRLALLAQSELLCLLFAALVFGLEPVVDETLDTLLSIVLVGVIITFAAYLIPQIMGTVTKHVVLKYECVGKALEFIPKVKKWREIASGKQGKNARNSFNVDQDIIDEIAAEGRTIVVKKLKNAHAGKTNKIMGDGMVQMQRNPLADVVNSDTLDAQMEDAGYQGDDSTQMKFSANPLMKIDSKRRFDGDRLSLADSNGGMESDDNEAAAERKERRSGVQLHSPTRGSAKHATMHTTTAPKAADSKKAGF